MKQNTKFSLIGIAIIVVIVIIINPDFENLKSTIKDIRNSFSLVADNKSPKKNFSNKYDIEIIEDALLGTPDLISKINARIKNYTLIFTEADKEIQKISYDFSEDGKLNLRKISRYNSPEIKELITYNSNHFDQVISLISDSIPIQKRKYYYQNNRPNKIITEFLYPHGLSPFTLIDTIIYSRKTFRCENDSCIKYFNKNGTLKTAFIKGAKLKSPTMIKNYYITDNKDDYKLNKTVLEPIFFEVPPKNIISLIIKRIKFASREYQNIESENVFKSFNDFPIEIRHISSFESYDIEYSYLEKDIQENWNKVQVNLNSSTNGPYPKRTITANISIIYY